MSPLTTAAILAIAGMADTFQIFRGGGSDLVTGIDLRVQDINTNMNADIPNLANELREVKDKILTEFRTNRNRSPCHTLASTAFEYSCSALDTSLRRKYEDSSTASVVEGAIQAYAARLAICELREAHADIPGPCQALSPSEHSRGVNPSKESLGKCVKSLEERSQSWTSYSNSKQNIFIICHALSASARNEEMLEIFEDFTRAAAEAGEHLLYAPQHAHELFEGVKHDTRQFVASLYENDAVKQRELRDHWTDLKHDMTTDLAATIHQFQEETLRIQNEGSATTLHHLQQLHDALFQLTDHASALTVRQTENAVAQQEQADFITALIQSDLVQAVGLATRGLADQQRLMNASHNALLNLGTGMANLVLQAEGAEARLQTLDAGLQAIHSEAEKLHAAVNETSAAVFDARASAMELQETFESVASFFGSGWWMGGGIAGVGTFLTLACGLSLLTFGAWERWAGFSRLGAGCAALASGFALASISTTYIVQPCSRLPTLILNAFHSIIAFLKSQLEHQFEHQQHRTIAAGAFVVLACFCVCLIYSLRLIFKTQKQKREHSKLDVAMAPYDPASPPVVAKWIV